MRTIEFEAEVTESGQLSVPADALASIPAGARAKVVVMLSEDAPDDDAIERLASRSISDYYSAKDAIYDDYPRG
jgi:hypothetical protein